MEPGTKLWWLTVSPAIWLAHFFASYVTAAVWCAKVAERDGSLATVRVAVLGYSLVALAGIAAVGWRSHRRHRAGESDPPHDFDTPEDRNRFLGLAAFLLSVLSAIGVVYVAMPIVFLESCR